jgi:hypothetical protein
MSNRSAINHRYDTSAKGRARRARYDHSAKGRARYHRSNNSLAGKLRVARYGRSAKGRARQKYYRAKPEVKEYYKFIQRGCNLAKKIRENRL